MPVKLHNREFKQTFDSAKNRKRQRRERQSS